MSQPIRVTRDELLALAARVEALTRGDDWFINREIVETRGLPESWNGKRVIRWTPKGESFDCSTEGGLHTNVVRVLNYTGSIDDALTLVPEGHIWTIYSDGCAGVEPRDDDPEELADGTIWAATPALALTAAALRAQAALMEGEDG